MQAFYGFSDPMTAIRMPRNQLLAWYRQIPKIVERHGGSPRGPSTAEQMAMAAALGMRVPREW